MHSSRMHTICCGGCHGGICLGGVCLGGVCLWGVCWEVSAWRCLPKTPSPLWTEWQMPVKILPCRNYVAVGNNTDKLHTETTYLRPGYNNPNEGGIMSSKPPHGFVQSICEIFWPVDYTLSYKIEKVHPLRIDCPTTCTNPDQNLSFTVQSK